MAFDIAPSPPHTAAKCDFCPVQACPARCEDTQACWRAMVGVMPPLTPGRGVMVEMGVPLPALFSVRAGCIKSYALDAEGNEHIRAFHFPGDLVGLDALGCERSLAATAPVTPSQVCAVPAEALRQRLATDAALAGHLLRRTGDVLRRAMALQGEFSADQRVAAFLLYVHARIGSGDRVRLPMTRREIGSYLRLATETVCRVLTRFEQKGWLRSEDKRITLVDRQALRELAEPVGLVA